MIGKKKKKKTWKIDEKFNQIRNFNSKNNIQNTSDHLNIAWNESKWKQIIFKVYFTKRKNWKNEK